MTPEQLRHRRRERAGKRMLAQCQEQIRRHEESQRKYELKRQEQKLIDDLMQKATVAAVLAGMPDLSGGVCYQAIAAQGEMGMAEARLKAFRAINSRV